MAKKLITYPIEQYSGIQLTKRHVDEIKSHHVNALKEKAGGDAPKDVIRLYKYGEVRKDKPKYWKKHIAKIGHKWYPNESITEHFLTRIGQKFYLPIANSQILIMEGYIRFLSEHFHKDEQVLYHGAEILSRYFNEKNTEWIDELEQNKDLKSVIDIEDVIEAVMHIYPKENVNILNNLFHLIIFDALTGNNDRHYYNWGVVAHLKGEHLPYFSPFYDSARGLWWNTSDEKIKILHKDLLKKNVTFRNYVDKSIPKISIPKDNRCNHFKLVEYLKENKYLNKEHTVQWSNWDFLNETIEILNTEFKPLFIKERREVIELTLRCRFEILHKILN